MARRTQYPVRLCVRCSPRLELVHWSWFARGASILVRWQFSRFCFLITTRLGECCSGACEPFTSSPGRGCGRLSLRSWLKLRREKISVGAVCISSCLLRHKQRRGPGQLPERRQLREPRQLLEAEVELAELQPVVWTVSFTGGPGGLVDFDAGCMVLEEVYLWPPP